MFGTAQQVEGQRWRVLHHQNAAPQQSRDDLTSVIRKLAGETSDPALRGQYEAAYTTLEWDMVDDLTGGDTRVRVIRIERFIRVREHEQIAEPSRPSDPDPLDHDDAELHRTMGFVMDPDALTGWGDAGILHHMLPGNYPAWAVPADVRADSLWAVEEYPGGVLLPVAFAIGEKADDDSTWKPL